MKTKLTKSSATWPLAGAFLATALLSATAQEGTQLPSVSGHVTLLNVGTNQSLTLTVQAEAIEQGLLLVPSGTIVAMTSESEFIPFEVTELEFARVDCGGIIAGTQADITAVNRERDLTLRLRLYDEDAEAVRQLPADYHLPFRPGDCATYLKIGETEYEAALLQSLQNSLKVDLPAS